MSRDTIENSRLWRVTDCTRCKGKGRVWYPGCGDSDAPCGTCDGVGQTGRYREIDTATGKPAGPWLRDA